MSHRWFKYAGGAPDPDPTPQIEAVPPMAMLVQVQVEMPRLDGGALAICSTSISDLGSEDLALRAPITVVLEQYEDEVVALYPEVEAWAAGRSAFEAVDRLKDEIASLYRELSAKDDATLGAAPLRWKRALGAVVRTHDPR